MSKDDDEKLFREAMRGIKPLKSSNRIELKSEKVHKKIIRRVNKTEMESNISRDTYYIRDREDVTGECRLNFSQPGLDPKVLKQLKAGKYQIELTIDLHGYTLAEAEQKLIKAWHYIDDNQLRSLLIIHGKGKQAVGSKAILKSLVNRFLHSMPNVLAFCSAKPQNGGVGAVYVLLKRKRC